MSFSLDGRAFSFLWCVFWFLALAACGPAVEPAPTPDSSRHLSAAEELVERSIEFHDPQATWATSTFELRLEESRPDGSLRATRLEIDNATGRFELESEREDRQIWLSVAADPLVGEKVEASVDGVAVAELEDPSVAARLRLDPAGALRTRNYYLYLYGLPMKLRDPGGKIAPEVHDKEFQRRPAREVRVSYDAEVGSDVWYFYFAPDSAELIGYRFYHDEDKGDGEYIVLEGLADVGSLRLPKSRTWFTHQGNELLGTDSIAD